MNAISIVIPTKNEQGNIARLLNWSIMPSLQEQEYEVIVVDDSNDRTKEIAERCGAKVIQGQGKGLGQAIIDGILQAKNDIIVVMDADLSHPANSIPDLIRPIINQGYDMTVGSRYAGGKIVGWEWYRKIVSRTACLLALPITSIKDSTSGFFAVKKSLIDNVKLEGKSWKIMLEILVKAKPGRVCEVPITFEVRKSGKSKFNQKQVVAYVKHLFSLCLYKYIISR